MRLTVQVTEEHIENGEHRDCKYCPIALAVAEAAGKKSLVSVGTTSAALRKDGEPTLHALLPYIAQSFIARYDNQAPGIEPIEFELEFGEVKEV